MSVCNAFSMDIIFQRFKVVEFPRTIVGLSSTTFLDVDINLNTTAYVKTLCDGKLMIFEDARKVSAFHRAFELTQEDDHTLKIVFKPSDECISKAKISSHFHDRFVFDIHLIHATQVRCCHRENHAEIGRYYICGPYEYCQITHQPEIIDFGPIMINQKDSKQITIENNSTVACKLKYCKVSTIDVIPDHVVLHPNTKRNICIHIKPSSLLTIKHITFQISSHDGTVESAKNEVINNNIIYKIYLKYSTSYPPNKITYQVKSLHTLCDKNPLYSYSQNELIIKIKRQQIALQHLNDKKHRFQKKPIPKITDINACINICMSNHLMHLCNDILKNIKIFELFGIVLNPCLLDFGKVELNSFGTEELSIRNNSKYKVIISLLNEECITYTDKHKAAITLTILPFTEVCINVNCLGFVEGSYSGTFKYIIENIYFLQHPFTLQVGNPTLLLKDKILKFGMLSSENYITSVPITIYNNFNKPIEFSWEITNAETPFLIIPSNGSVPNHSSRICDIRYLCKPSRTKIHEIDLISHGNRNKIIPVELNITTKKHAIKFLETAVHFGDIPLNLEVIERVNIENSSKEFSVFNVVDPLIPGLNIEPMHGIIKPRMIIIIKIIVKIPYMLEISFDMNIKINNKETIVLPISGNVVEPKLIIQPKHIYMARIPCYMISYIPVALQNTGTTKCLIKVIDTGDENIFNIYIINENVKEKLSQLVLQAGASITVFIKLYDIFRREYDIYLPFQINNLIGPTNKNASTTDLQYYINGFKKLYENNIKIKVKKVNKPISYCRIEGVITLPWIKFSTETFIFTKSSLKEFTITNVSTRDFLIDIFTCKLAPNFSLKLLSDNLTVPVDNDVIKLEMRPGSTTTFCIKFHPKGIGKYAAVAEMFIDKIFTLPYYNLTFIGNNDVSVISPSTYTIAFPPCYIGCELSRIVFLTVNKQSHMQRFSYKIPGKYISVNFVKFKSNDENGLKTVATTEICVNCNESYIGNSTITFYYGTEVSCEIKVLYCYTFCPITLHSNAHVDIKEHPYPYYPSEVNNEMRNYMDTCTEFLEKWLFQQGFRKDFYPEIPDSFHVISPALSSQKSGKAKGISVTYLNFIRRIAGPLMKQIKNQTFFEKDGRSRYVKEICNTYNEIMLLLKCRGADIWFLQPHYLLSYDQFIVYCTNLPMENKAYSENNKLIENIELFNRLSKQCWIDFIIQTYKVFILDSCFLKCNFENTHRRNIINIIIDWFNYQIQCQYNNLLRKDSTRACKVIKNITSDLSDGIAIVSAILNHCPFLKKHFAIFMEIDENNVKDCTTHNTCLIIEALNELKVNFPLSSTDLLQPNFLQMLFLSIHLYVVLPSFRPHKTLKFNPPIASSFTIQLSLNSSNQEKMAYSFAVLNNEYNSFTVEKVTSSDNVRNVFLNVKYNAYFVKEVHATLIVQGYNKTKIFDSYIVFFLEGSVGSLIPHKKCKILCPLYRPYKAYILVSSPFEDVATYQVYVLDKEPTSISDCKYLNKSNFSIQRLNVIDNSIVLRGKKKDTNEEIMEQKLGLNIICLSKQVGNAWIWFTSDIGEFLVKVTTHPRVDLALEMIHASLGSWPLQPCNCGDSCACYRTTVVPIPHRNDLLVKCLRFALLENATDAMISVFDELIGSVTGNIIIAMLLEEGGSDMSEVAHILNREAKYLITSRSLKPRVNVVTFSTHSDAVFSLPITLPLEPVDKYSITLTSECGMDIRTYRIMFGENKSKVTID